MNGFDKLGTSKSEILFIIILVVCFLAPPAIWGQWWLFGVFLLFFMCFGVVELVAKAKTGMTVSQHFWALKKKNKFAAWTIAVCMLIAWLALLWHFLG
jgi:hypothetical protein